MANLPLQLQRITAVKMIDIDPLEDSASLVASSAISFVNTLPAQMKASWADVLNSTLFAQLAANRQHNRQLQPAEWYTRYKFVLEQVGYNVANADFRLQDVGRTELDTHSRVDELLLALAKPSLPSQETDLLAKMIRALVTTPSQLDQFNYHASGAGTTADFQIGIASLRGKNAQLKLGAYHYVATQNINNVLGHAPNTADMLAFQHIHHALELDSEFYSQVRSAVLDKLGQNATHLISEIKL